MSDVRKNDFARAINALTYKEMLDVAQELGVMLDAKPQRVAEYLGEVADKILEPDTTPDPFPIPGAVYYSPTHGNFFSAMSRETMGAHFRRKWFRRRAEFPQDPDPIPGSVYYSPASCNFYSAVSHEGMGKDFYEKWVKRRAEFPQEEPKPVLPLRNPLTPGADEFQHKDHKS